MSFYQFGIVRLSGIYCNYSGNEFYDDLYIGRYYNNSGLRAFGIHKTPSQLYYKNEDNNVSLYIHSTGTNVPIYYTYINIISVSVLSTVSAPDISTLTELTITN